jgi:hypothetical protein
MQRIGVSPDFECSLFAVPGSLHHLATENVNARTQSAVSVQGLCPQSPDLPDE